MNVIFGGKISLDQTEQHLQELTSLSKKYVPDEPERIVLTSERDAPCMLAGLRGLNAGIGVYEDTQYAVFLDGEIYNPEVFGQAAAVNRERQSTRVRDDWAHGIASLYGKDGSDGLGCLNGIFALIIYDKTHNTILLSRDQKGYRMLYYSVCPKEQGEKGESGGKFIFGTRLWSVARLRAQPLERARDVELFHLQYGFSPPEKTVVAGIEKVPPGSVLRYDLSSHEMTHQKFPAAFTWHHTPQAKQPDLDVSQAKKLLYHAFMDSLDEITHFDERVAVLLGGLDSAAVAAGLKKLGRHVETYSFQWTAERFNQKNVEQFQSFTNIKHHWRPMDLAFIRRHLRDMPEYIDEPRSELTYLIGTTELCGLAREHGFNLVATGDGAEDAMTGYPAYHNMVRLIDQVKKIPPAVLQLLVGVLHHPLFVKRFGHAGRNVLTALKKALYQDEKSYFLTFRLFDDAELSRLLPDDRPESVGELTNSYLEQMLDQHRDLGPVLLAHKGNEYHASIRYKHAAPAAIYDVAVVSPFLHKGFVQVVRSMPVHAMYPHGYQQAEQAKWLFREMVKEYDLLPEIVSDQEKDTPGNSPIDYWLENEFKQEAFQTIDELPDDFSRPHFRDVFSKKWLLELYRTVGISAVTSHAQQALIGYALFWSNLHAKAKA